MLLNAEYFEEILLELISENTLACAAVLKILDVQFTNEISTLAVTNERRPVLLVNLDFINQYCQCEDDVKALLLHEFLHVLLNHTMDFKVMTPALNLALDAVINAIIHRLAGDQYSEFFSRFYADEDGLAQLLHPHDEKYNTLYWTKSSQKSLSHQEKLLFDIWTGLYEGKIVAEDILDLAEDLTTKISVQFLGNHTDSMTIQLELDQSKTTLKSAVEDCLKQMFGSGIWREADPPGSGGYRIITTVKAKTAEYRLWEKETWRVMHKCLTKDRNTRQSTLKKVTTTLPVLTPNDRRAWLRSGWSPILPFAKSISTICKIQQGQSAQVYLDVSGSMGNELEAIIGLLWKLRRHVKSPFWSFSNTIEPAVIINGVLKTKGTGGTDLEPVLKHIIETAPQKAMIITDGFVGKINPKTLKIAQNKQQIFAIISRDGSASEFQKSGIQYVQLGRFSV